MTQKDWSKVKWKPKHEDDKDTTITMRCKMSFKKQLIKLAIERGISQAEIMRQAIDKLSDNK